MQKLLSFILGGAIVIGLCVAPIRAQLKNVAVYPPIKKVSKPKVSSGGGGGGGGTRRSRPVVREREKVVVREVRNVRTSNLSVTTQPGAKVMLVSLTAGGTSPNPVTADSKGVAVFENLKVAEYDVKVELEGFKSKDTDEPIKIKPQTTHGIKLELKPVTYDLKVDVNIPDGEVRFAASVPTGRMVGENIETREIKGYCVVRIENKKAVIPDLEKGYYNLIITPSAVEYEPLRAIVKVPDDVPEASDESGEVESYSFELEKKISTEQFLSSGTTSEWELPSGWRLGNQKMQTNGLPGIALPRSEQYRYYVDFDMRSSVTSLDGKTVGFVFRAEDTENYYLVQLSGARAAEPYLIRGYVVKDGIRGNPIFTTTIDHIVGIINKQFTFIIEGRGNTFKLFVEDSATGDSKPLGNMVDPFDNYKKGAVGIAGSQNSNSEVVFFTVLCKGNCK